MLFPKQTPGGMRTFVINMCLILYLVSNVCHSMEHLGDNFIQNFHLGRYIVGYMVSDLVFNMISEPISQDIPHQMKILNMAIPILMVFCSLISNWGIASSIKLIQ